MMRMSIPSGTGSQFFEAAALEKKAKMHKNLSQTYGQPGGSLTASVLGLGDELERTVQARALSCGMIGRTPDSTSMSRNGLVVAEEQELAKILTCHLGDLSCTVQLVFAFPLAAGVPYPLVLSPEVAALSMSGSSALVAISALLLKRMRLSGGSLPPGPSATGVAEPPRPST